MDVREAPVITWEYARAPRTLLVPGAWARLPPRDYVARLATLLVLVQAHLALVASAGAAEAKAPGLISNCW